METVSWKDYNPRKSRKVLNVPMSQSRFLGHLYHNQICPKVAIKVAVHVLTAQGATLTFMDTMCVHHPEFGPLLPGQISTKTPPFWRDNPLKLAKNCPPFGRIL